MGYVEGQITGNEEFGGIQIEAFGSTLPQRSLAESFEYSVKAYAEPAAAMGLGVGGKMKQDIYPDPYGIDPMSTGDAGPLRRSSQAKRP